MPPILAAALLVLVLLLLVVSMAAGFLGPQPVRALIEIAVIRHFERHPAPEGEARLASFWPRLDVALWLLSVGSGLGVGVAIYSAIWHAHLARWQEGGLYALDVLMVTALTNLARRRLRRYIIEVVLAFFRRVRQAAEARRP